MTKTYAVFLVPVGPPRVQLQELIDALAAEYGFPSFVPHVSILGRVDGEEVDVLAKAQALAAASGQLQLATGPIDYSTTYFQCVFARIKTQPALLELYNQAVQLFGQDPNRFYMPHLSLVYGTFDVRRRQEIAQRLEVPAQTFKCAVHVIETDPDPANWKLVKEFELA